LQGGAGADTYLLGRGSAHDVIDEDSGNDGSTDVVAVGAGVSADQVWFNRSGEDLTVSIIGTHDKVTISDWYNGSNGTIEKFQTSDGLALLNNRVDALVDAMAGFAPPAPGQTSLPDEYERVLNPIIAANWK
ncbi:calcium-binding protein, partial [Thermodesulfobacteriota bacterium]